MTLNFLSLLCFFSQTFQKDVVDNAPIHHSVNSNKDDLVNLCDTQDIVTDVPYIKDEVQHINERWDKLRADTDDLMKGTTYLQRAVDEYETALAPVEEVMVQMETIADETTPVSWDLLDMESYVNNLNVSILKLLSIAGL